MDYLQSLFIKFHWLEEGDDTVDEYMEKFFELYMHARMYKNWRYVSSKVQCRVMIGNAR